MKDNTNACQLVIDALIDIDTILKRDFHAKEKKTYDKIIECCNVLPEDLVNRLIKLNNIRNKVAHEKSYAYKIDQQWFLQEYKSVVASLQSLHYHGSSWGSAIVPGSFHEESIQPEQDEKLLLVIGAVAIAASTAISFGWTAYQEYPNRRKLVAAEKAQIEKSLSDPKSSQTELNNLALVPVQREKNRLEEIIAQEEISRRSLLQAQEEENKQYLAKVVKHIGQILDRDFHASDKETVFHWITGWGNTLLDKINRCDCSFPKDLIIKIVRFDELRNQVTIINRLDLKKEYESIVENSATIKEKRDRDRMKKHLYYLGVTVLTLGVVVNAIRSYK